MNTTRQVLGASLLLLAAGCAASPWKREKIYARSGFVLYREHMEEDGKQVPLGHLHPIDLPADKAVLILYQLVFEERSLFKRSRRTYIFDRVKEIPRMVEPLLVALRTITPDERLRFLLTRSNWDDLLVGMTSTSGVIFSDAGGVLSLAFDRIQDRGSMPEDGDPAKVVFRGNPTQLNSGSPVIPGAGMKVHVDPATGETFPRWVDIVLADVEELPLAPAPTPEPKPEVSPPINIVVPERPPLEGSPEVASPAARARGAESSGATPSTSTGRALEAEPPAPARDDARYLRVRERIEGLKRLRDDGALSEEEYRRELDKALAEL
ncbi:MAG TPA: hypothetical protein VMT52_06885 [Planctomycetota bacterium]|nr:hypothetical protein [Planctomycetota bacterium]